YRRAAGIPSAEVQLVSYAYTPAAEQRSARAGCHTYETGPAQRVYVLGGGAVSPNILNHDELASFF
ncbi:MAG: hypothetical protein M3Z37_03965, partial [Candidatus Eremiobacteraeota bacterium]|nr:hypothetical protein [Candidatus Eremiobacteraeota bacterium]